MTCKGCGKKRASCLECVEKHLGAAMVLLAEVADGYTAHRLLAIGHLHEAAEESRAWPGLHMAIRNARIRYQREGTMPDWGRIIEQVEAVKPADK